MKKACTEVRQIILTHVTDVISSHALRWIFYVLVSDFIWMFRYSVFLRFLVYCITDGGDCIEIRLRSAYEICSLSFHTFRDKA